MAGRDLFAEGRNLFAGEERSDPGSLPAPIAEGAGALNRGFGMLADFPVEIANAAIWAANQNPAIRESLATVLEPLRGRTEGDGTVRKLTPEGFVERPASTNPPLPKPTEAIRSVEPRFGAENFMEPGLAREFIQTGGEFAPSFATALTGSVPTLAQRTQQLADDAVTGAAQLAGRTRTGDISAVRQTVSEAGEAVADPKARAALRQGFTDDMVARIKASSAATRGRMRRMLNTKERQLTTADDLSDAIRPSDEVGNAVSRRIAVVAKANSRAGKQVRAQANRLKTKTVDTSVARQSFLDDLAEEGIRVGDEGVDLTGTPYEDMGTVKDLLNLVLRQSRAAGDNAYKAHRLKNTIDKRVSFGKQSEGGLDTTIENIVKGYRRGIDKALDDTFDAYRVPNETFAETRSVLDAYQDAVGKRVDFDGQDLDKTLGQLSRRLFSNAVSRVDQLKALGNLEEMAIKHGLKQKDSPLALARFADELETVVRRSQRTDITSAIARGTSDVAESPARALRDRTIEAGLEKVLGVDEKKQIAAMRALLAP